MQAYREYTSLYFSLHWGSHFWIPSDVHHSVFCIRVSLPRMEKAVEFSRAVGVRNKEYVAQNAGLFSRLWASIICNICTSSVAHADLLMIFPPWRQAADVKRQCANATRLILGWHRVFIRCFLKDLRYKLRAYPLLQAALTITYTQYSVLSCSNCSIYSNNFYGCTI